MELIVNFMLLAASGAAAFYCFVLNKRLADLKDTNSGLGASIATMSQTVDTARSVVALAKESSTQSIAQLSPLVEETRIIIPKLTELIDVISELSEIAVKDIDESCESAIVKLDKRIQDAQELGKEVTAQVEAQLQNLADAIETTSLEDSDEQICYIDELETSRSDRTARVASAIDAASKQRDRHTRAG